MSLTPGTRLGPYEVSSAIGAGGMGEVYRARDTRLQRDVAVKVLPADVAADPARLQRFEDEARATAALNHPNILSVFDVGTEGTTTYLVSELLEGQTLRDLLAAGALPLRKGLDLATQIALGLAAAHQRGIVHRDLKPENVFIVSDGRLKILDFGLAKLVAPPATAAPSAHGATGITAAIRGAGASTMATAVGTEPGTVLGTVGYMSPEQVRGQVLDHRSDIFAFGAVVYEMLTGRRAFYGDSPADTITAILQREVSFAEPAPTTVPQALEQVVLRCLEKDPGARFQSTADLVFAIRVAASGSSSSQRAADVTTLPPRRSPALSYAVLAAAAIVAVAIAVGVRSRAVPVTADSVVMFDLPLPDGTAWTGEPTLAVSPDGETLAFTVVRDGERQIMVRRLDNTTSRLLRARGSFGMPAWSPDSRRLATATTTGVAVINPEADNTEQTIGSAVCNAGAAALRWPDPTHLLLTCATTPGIRELNTDGQLRQVTTPAGDAQDLYHMLPSLLPDGRSLLFTRTGADRRSQVGVVRDASGNDTVLPGHAQATYVLGHLVFPRGDQLYAQPFDLKTGTVAGTASPLGVPVYRSTSVGTFPFAVGGRTLVSIAGVATSRSQFVAFDRQGRRVGEFGAPAEWRAFDISASGDRVVAGSSSSLWVLETARPEPRRLTFDDRDDVDPNLAADGTVYFVRRGAGGGLYRISIEGGAESQIGSASFQSLDDVADDGSRIVYRRGSFNTEAWVTDRAGATERVLVRARASVDQVPCRPMAAGRRTTPPNRDARRCTSRPRPT